MILTQELEKHGVKLETVTEDVDNSELGKLISYIRGFASKLEASKIRERTMRGKRARALEGRIPSGGSSKIYGYDYIKVAQDNGGRRVINETEASWVRQIYQWLVNDGMSTTAITYRLRALNAPTKCGGFWGRQSVLAIVTNPAYTGKTYVFTSVNGKQFRKPEEDWINIPNVTPAIISQEMFEAAQKQLKVNRAKSTRNMKREYLLRGHIHCRECGRAFSGGTTVTNRKGKSYATRRYRCSGTIRMNSPVNRCHNRSWSADTLEATVWAQIEGVINKPELIITEVEKQRQAANKLGVLEVELREVERHLKALDREQEQLLQWALKDFPEEIVTAENKRLNQKRGSLKAQKAELETQIEASREATVNQPKLERFIKLMREKLSALDFETKRMVLDMLGIKVWLDGHNVEITGVLPIADDVVNVTMQS